MPPVGVPPKNPTSAPSEYVDDVVREAVLPTVSGDVAGHRLLGLVALVVAFSASVNQMSLCGRVSVSPSGILSDSVQSLGPDVGSLILSSARRTMR